jgi:hypothetical protein
MQTIENNFNAFTTWNDVFVTAPIRQSRRFIARTPVRIQSGTVKDFIQCEFSKIEAVEQIFVEQYDQVVYVTIVIDQPENSVLDLIIDGQERIITALKEYGFDFNVVFRMGREAAQLISPETPLFTKV